MFDSERPTAEPARGAFPMWRAALRAAILAAWLGCIAWLVRFEAFPEYFTRTLNGYKGLFSGNVLIEDSWMRLLFNGAPIGYSHTNVDLDEDGPVPQYTVFNQVRLRLKIMGEDQAMNVSTTVQLDMLYQLQQFEFTLSSRGYNLRMVGTRRTETDFDVILRTGNSTQRMSITIPTDVLIYSPMAEMAVRNLQPGQTLTLKTLDPASLSSAPITLRAERREPYTAGGQTVEATVVSTEYRGLAVRSWIDPAGGVLRQETPFGWTLERCTMEEAFAALAESDGAGDLLAGMSVKLIGRIRNPKETPGLRLRLTGVAFAPGDLLSNRQSVAHAKDSELELWLRRSTFPDADAPAPDAAALAPFLAASPAVQADHPEIRARAERITEGAATPAEKARRIYEWVYRNVDKQITISLPSALDVLRTLKGDCNEHTYLFTALARAAGLPAAIKVGLVYNEGAFYYHAWPAVFVGDWVEMDPTWGQETVDATHIALIDGELANQVDLIRTMGQLQIEVLDEM